MQAWLAKTLHSCRAQLTSIVGWSRMMRLASQGKAPITVLFYHRIANDHPNSWTLPCGAFEEQLHRLRKSFEFIGLDEVQRRVRFNDSRRPAVAITFDDGYADNNHFALPLLARFRIPYTYFVCVDSVVQGSPFPHDIAAGYPLAPNSISDLLHWRRHGMEVGLHTRTHHDFSLGENSAIIQREIHSANQELQSLVQQPIRYFAFPYGTPAQLRPTVMRSLYEMGMSGYCSAYGAYNLPGRDDFHIRRIHADPESARFKNWIYFDRTKLALEPHIVDTIGVSQPTHSTRVESGKK